MKKSTRNVLIILLGIFVVIGGVFAYGLYRVYSFWSSVAAAKEIPPELQEVRVLKGQDFLRKTDFFKLDSQKMLTTIKKSTDVKDEKERQKYLESEIAKGIYGFDDLKVIDQEVIAVGQFGAYVFDFNGTQKRFAAFEPTARKVRVGPYETESYSVQANNLRIIQLEKNRYGFLTFGSTDGVRIFDENGLSIWAY